jgi:hypothetical protein
MSERGGRYKEIGIRRERREKEERERGEKDKERGTRREG